MNSSTVNGDAGDKLLTVRQAAVILAVSARLVGKMLARSRGLQVVVGGRQEGLDQAPIMAYILGEA